MTRNLSLGLSICYFRSALFNRCVRCTLGYTKICVGCTATKSFTRVHHKRVTLIRDIFPKTFC